MYEEKSQNCDYPSKVICGARTELRKQSNDSCFTFRILNLSQIIFRTSTTFKKLSESKWILCLASRRIMPKVLGLSWRNFLLADMSSRGYFWHDNRFMCNTWSIQARRMSGREVSQIWLSKLFFRRVSDFFLPIGIFTRELNLLALLHLCIFLLISIFLLFFLE